MALRILSYRRAYTFLKDSLAWLYFYSKLIKKFVRVLVVLYRIALSLACVISHANSVMYENEIY